jgi:hypothetical protein
MKAVLICFITCTAIVTLQAQTLTYTDFKNLIPSLNQEDWKVAYKKSGALLDRSLRDTSEIHAMVVYIHLYAGAGMVANGKMSHQKLRKEVLRFRGQRILMSAHPITNKEGALNQTLLTTNDTLSTAFTAATNKAGTCIFCFEKFILREKIQAIDFPLRAMVRCGGRLENIEMNPNKSLIWIMRLTITDAFIRELK